MGGDIEEYPFIFMNTPASLQILASVEMALMVWRCKYANTSHLYEKPRLFFEQQFSCKEVLVVSVPHRIQAQINEKIANIGQELRKWIDFHSDRDFLDAEFRKCFKHVVADFSGSIGYKHTAMNMLNSGEFSDAVNYKIACMYCLEDQVKRFWPSVANESLIDVNSEHDKCNLSYWNGWIKSGGNLITDTESVKRLMNNAAFRRNDATAFDYFCKMLPDRERVFEFISLLGIPDTGYNYPAVIHSLSLRTLDRVQAQRVFKNVPYSMFGILTKNDKNFQCARQLWTFMGHSILENKWEFFLVVRELWSSVFFPAPAHCGGLNYTECGQINDLLLEIWSHAADELKAHVSNEFLVHGLLNLSDSRNGFRRFGANEVSRPVCYGHDMTFMLEIMSKLTVVDRDQQWQKNWRQLASRSKPLYLEQFMRFCLPNDDAIELFKIKIANFEDLFKLLIEEGFYSDLKDYLLFCSKDAEQFQQLGKKVLGSNLHLISLHDDDRFAKFEWFVSEVFVSIEEFKTQMISSAECVKNLLTARQADKISSKDFSRIIRRFVNNEEELQQVKRQLFEHCRTYLVDYDYANEEFNADQWQEFLEWCTADHEEISAFKRSLNVDAIFLKRLGDYLLADDEISYTISKFLDRFLKWYFGNEQDAKNFKLEKVKNYQQIEVLRVEMEKKYIDDGSLMYGLLLWFFDDNTENVGEFCKTCNCILRSPTPTRVKNDFKPIHRKRARRF